MIGFLNLMISNALVRFIVYSALAASIGSAVWLVRDYSNRGVKIADLQAESRTKDGTIASLQANARLDQAAVMTLDARLKERDVDLIDFCNAFDAIKGAKDGSLPAGDAIGRALEHLQKKDAR